MTEAYTEESIQVLKGLEAVRKRPGMYLGNTHNGDALHKCLDEVLDNSVDEHLAGHCGTIHVRLQPGGYCEVQDDGRGIPVGLHPTEKRSTLEVILCTLAAGGKFDDDSGRISAGLHGVGVSAVNAVSQHMHAWVHRDGKVWEQNYEEGQPVSEVLPINDTNKTGTCIRWLRDELIFEDVLEYDLKRVRERVQELAFLNPGLQIHLEDARKSPEIQEVHHYPAGIKSYLATKTEGQELLCPILHFRDGQGDEWSAEIALVWTDRHSEEVRAYSNNTFNQEGGTHLSGLRSGLTKLITGYAKKHKLSDSLTDGLTGLDTREGLVALVNVRLPNLSFSSQTKDKLVSPNARRAIEELFKDQVDYWFRSNPTHAKRIAEHAVLSARAREAARKAKSSILRKSLTDRSYLPGKLSDCSSTDPRISEIFLCEGDSAGGSSKAARDRKFQAILPLRGKVLNCERASLETITRNEEISTIITALGCGIEQNRTFAAERLRYHKVIIATDADIDGAHIRTLLLTFFYRSMPELIRRGHLYIALPPLFGARTKGLRSEYYFTSEQELSSWKETLQPLELKRLKISRFKGLGEMNPNELWSTTLDPDTRNIRQVRISDALVAEHTFNVLMGEAVDPRRQMIEDYAGEVTLDI